jgi:hypothetical protein
VTFRQVIEQERRWVPFRHTLSKEDQEVFDRMFACAKQQVQAEVQLGWPWGFKTVRMAVLVEHEKRGGEYEQFSTLSRSMTYATCRPRIWRNGSTAERISRDFSNYSGATASRWCPCEP